MSGKSFEDAPSAGEVASPAAARVGMSQRSGSVAAAGEPWRRSKLGRFDGGHSIIALALAADLKALGYDVEWAANGATALEIFQMRGPFDLLVTDMKMPRMDGHALA